MSRKIFALIGGAVMIFAAAAIMIWTGIVNNSFESTTATVTAVEYDPSFSLADDNNEDYRVTLVYNVGGTDYTTEITAGSGLYTVGENVEIKYDPEDPANTSVGTLSLPIAIAIGVVMIMIAVFVILKAIL